MHIIRASILALVAALLSAVAQIVLKFASEDFALSVEGILFNVPFIAGFFLLVITAALFMKALKFGDLNVLYPLLATSYVWVVIVSPLIFPSDSLNTLKIIGVAFIVLGTSAIGKGISRGAQ